MNPIERDMVNEIIKERDILLVEVQAWRDMWQAMDDHPKNHPLRKKAILWWQSVVDATTKSGILKKKELTT